MAAIIWSDVTALAPDVAGVASGAQTTILAFVNSALDVDSWGGEASPRVRLARIWLAAHYGATVGMGAASGPLIAEAGGGLSEQYAARMSSDALAATAYGAQYLNMLRTSAARAWVVI